MGLRSPENYRPLFRRRPEKASTSECHVFVKDTESRPEGPGQKRRRPMLGGSLDRG